MRERERERQREREREREDENDLLLAIGLAVIVASHQRVAARFFTTLGSVKSETHFSCSAFRLE